MCPIASIEHSSSRAGRHLGQPHGSTLETFASKRPDAAMPSPSIAHTSRQVSLKKRRNDGCGAAFVPAPAATLGHLISGTPPSSRGGLAPLCRRPPIAERSIGIPIMDPMGQPSRPERSTRGPAGARKRAMSCPSPARHPSSMMTSLAYCEQDAPPYLTRGHTSSPCKARGIL